MPVDVAIPEENLGTAEERGGGRQPFLDALEEVEQAEDCLLFSPGPDFAKACSCNDCRLKITELEEFEEEIKSKNELVLNYLGQLERDESLCLILMSTAHWTIDILDSLFQQLEALSEKTVEVPLKIEDPAYPKMCSVSLQLAQLLKDNQLLDSIEPSECDEAYVVPIAFKIDAGIYNYKQTKANIKAFDLLQNLAQIEQKKEAEGKMLDAAISKGLIVRQIELIKQLPMEDLYFEAEELIPKVCPVDENRRMVRDATVYMTKTNHAIIKQRKSFWRQFQAHPSSEDMARKGTGNKHNGLDKTLNLLLTMVDVFKSHWDREYEPFFTRYGRSDRKRQRTVGS